MVEIIYGENRELASLEGKSVAAVREQYKSEFEISDRAQAVLNGKPVKKKLEDNITLEDCDEICFVQKNRSRAPILVSALLIALSLTAGAFAYTYISTSTTLSITSAGGDFATVTANTTSQPSWTTYGFFKGTTGGGNLFDIDTTVSGYTGDLVATVYIANGDQLAKVYRVLALKIQAYDSIGAKIDINSDNNVDDKDFALLTLRNGAVDLFIDQSSADWYTIKLDSGYYVAHAYGLGWGGSASPVLFADIGQK